LPKLLKTGDFRGRSEVSRQKMRFTPEQRQHIDDLVERRLAEERRRFEREKEALRQLFAPDDPTIGSAAC
jgi:hypothetical protein